MRMRLSLTGAVLCAVVGFALPVPQTVTLGRRGTPAEIRSPAAVQQSSAEQEPASLEGAVLDAVTGAPVAKVRLVLAAADGNWEHNRQAVTDSSGRFRFENLRPGRYRLRASKNRYVRFSYGERRPGGRGAILTLRPGARLDDPVLKLTPAAVVAGRVLDEDGEPVAYARVNVLRYRYVDGEKRLMAVNRGASTNDLGEYRLFGLAPGRYYVSVTYQRPTVSFARPRNGRETPAESQAYPTLYYPGVPDVSQAAPLKLEPGEERRGIDFRLTPARAVTVSGYVRGAPGRIMVILRRQGESLWVTRGPGVAADRKTGKFFIEGVLPGAYVLEAVTMRENDRLFARLPVAVGPDGLRDVVLELRPGVKVSGRVAFDGEAPEGSLEKIRVSLLASANILFFGSRGGRVDPEGRFALESIVPGRHRVRVHGLPDGAYLKAAVVEGSDVLEDGLEVPEAGLAGLSVTIGLRAAFVTGAVLDEDGRPVASATVVLAPERRRRIDLFRNVTTDQYGRFLIQGIAPGKYRLFAFDDVESGAWRDPDFLAEWEDAAEEIELEEGGREAVELELIQVSDGQQ